ncbi:NUDIX domain-containing protein [Patescibacteria group bacterium AH-259-L07]|nr:NUDIX domain-containing protein [Patescibacteria group bacterium AH-259-L07]
MADELIDIYNENNEPLNIRKMKSEVHKNGSWHRASHIWIYNSKGEILLQLRAENKEFYPNMWDISASGHISAGEEPIISALREMEEEIGLSVKPEDLQFFKIRKHKAVYKKLVNNEFYYVYFLNFDGDIKKLTLQDEEVAKIQFFPIDKIEEELKTSPEKYVPHGDYWFEVIEEVRSRTNK